MNEAWKIVFMIQTAWVMLFILADQLMLYAIVEVSIEM
jgi:hypothetical protein